MDALGNLYGTTLEGGAANNGTVFKVDVVGNETVLHSFAGSPNDGSNPLSSLTLVNGKLFGTANTGGLSSCLGPFECGIMFSLDGLGNEQALVKFNVSNGRWPSGPLLYVSKKKLFYGTTTAGGLSNQGTVYLFK